MHLRSTSAPAAVSKGAPLDVENNGIWQCVYSHILTVLYTSYCTVLSIPYAVSCTVEDIHKSKCPMRDTHSLLSWVALLQVWPILEVGAHGRTGSAILERQQLAGARLSAPCASAPEDYPSFSLPLKGYNVPPDQVLPQLLSSSQGLQCPSLPGTDPSCSLPLKGYNVPDLTRHHPSFYLYCTALSLHGTALYCTV